MNLDLLDLIDYEIEILEMSREYAQGKLLFEINEEINLLIDSKEYAA